MTVTCALDSFKGSLTSLQAGESAAEGIRRVYPAAEIFVRPLADGGEGTLETLREGLGGEVRTLTVSGPLGKAVECPYAILPDGAVVVELAGAAGLTLIPPEVRDPLRTTTYGVGQVLRSAMAEGHRRFVVGIGGSATNDGGAGMLMALGFDLLDENGSPIPLGAAGLERLASVSDQHVPPELRECRFRVACDVDNPLCGPRGASAVFSPQKGADAAVVERLDGLLARFARITRETFPDADPDRPGAGAAGGVGLAFQAYLGGELCPGVQLVLEETGLEEYIARSDVVITGEGRLDAQTAMGKAPAGVAGLAKKYGLPVYALSGCLGKGASVCHAAGIDAFFPILRRVTTPEEAMDPTTAAANLAATAEQVFRLYRSARGSD